MIYSRRRDNFLICIIYYAVLITLFVLGSKLAISLTVVLIANLPEAFCFFFTEKGLLKRSRRANYAIAVTALVISVLSTALPLGMMIHYNGISARTLHFGELLIAALPLFCLDLILMTKDMKKLITTAGVHEMLVNLVPFRQSVDDISPDEMNYLIERDPETYGYENYYDMHNVNLLLSSYQFAEWLMEQYKGDVLAMLINKFRVQ